MVLGTNAPRPGLWLRAIQKPRSVESNTPNPDRTAGLQIFEKAQNLLHQGRPQEESEHRATKYFKRAYRFDRENAPEGSLGKNFYDADTCSSVGHQIQAAR